MKNTINIHPRPLAMLAMLLAPLWVLALPLQGATGHPTVAAHHSASQPLPMHSSDGEVIAYDTIHLCDSEWYTLSFDWKDTTFNILGMIGSEFVNHRIDIVHRVSGTPDTIFHLHMTYGGATTGIDSVTACDSYSWINGFQFTFSTNSPTHTLSHSNRYGCDSTITLRLTINHSSSETINDSSCNSFVWNFTDKFGNSESRNYTHSGSYSGVLANSYGEDFQPNFAPDGRTLYFVSNRVGGEERNIILSWHRAKMVYEHLLGLNVSESQLSYHGYGSSMPIDTNATPEGRANNRRTDVVVVE